MDAVEENEQIMVGLMRLDLEVLGIQLSLEQALTVVRGAGVRLRDYPNPDYFMRDGEAALRIHLIESGQLAGDALQGLQVEAQEKAPKGPLAPGSAQRLVARILRRLRLDYIRQGQDAILFACRYCQQHFQPEGATCETGTYFRKKPKALNQRSCMNEALEVEVVGGLHQMYAVGWLPGRMDPIETMEGLREDRQAWLEAQEGLKDKG